jgi:glycerol uptake facilitator-like aquaporin
MQSLASEQFGKFGVAFTVFALILISGPITGAHFNPAVTMGVYISNKDWREDATFCLMIMVAEFIGGIWGVCLTWMCLFNSDAQDVTWAQIPKSEVIKLGPAETVSYWNAF